MLLLSLSGLTACHDWDFYDPRLGETGGASPTSTTSAGGSDTGTGGSAGDPNTGGSGGEPPITGGAGTGGEGGSPPPPCGDGSVAASEECDDGGTADGDGCSADCTVECPGEKDPATFHCYIVEATTLVWDAAHAACLARGPGWDLAAINSIAERDYTDDVDLITVTYTWLGGRDMTEGVYTWSTGEAFSGEATSLLGTIDGAPEDCLAMERILGDVNDVFADEPCNVPHQSMCELTPAGT